MTVAKLNTPDIAVRDQPNSLDHGSMKMLNTGAAVADEAVMESATAATIIHP